MRDGYFDSDDGLSLYFREHIVPGARAHALVVHGVSEHYGRYRWVEERLAQAGIGFSMMDLRGHGQSEGTRVHVDRFQQYLGDLDRFFARVEGVGAPLFLIGHSLGGLIAVRWAQTRRPLAGRLRGLITSGAALKATLKPPAPVFFLLAQINKLYSRTPLPGLVPVDKICRDPEIVRRYTTDPLVHKNLTTGFGIASMQAMQEALAEAHRIDVPALVMHGGADALVDNSASSELFAGLKVADKTLKIYPNFYHELFNEPERDAVLAEVCAWMLARAGERAGASAA